MACSVFDRPFPIVGSDFKAKGRRPRVLPCRQSLADRNGIRRASVCDVWEECRQDDLPTTLLPFNLKTSLLETFSLSFRQNNRLIVSDDS